MIDVEHQHAVDLHSSFVKHFFESFCLGNSAGESVEQETCGFLCSVNFGRDHLDNDLIGNKLAF